jgi:DNA polymerase-3 subunit gamma/tau
MASQALYRRYRSQTFDELIGQEHVVRTLRNALAEGRLGHAYLFTGPRGVGKTSVARLLAKAVNCTAAPDQRPCGVCASCQEIAEGRSVDVIELDAASHTSVEDAREIIERVQFRPTNGAYKVYIIDETHMLSTAAFNALLKTLEEPPAHALFILATTEVHKVPQTIRSRCQFFSFSRHTVARTAAHLRDVATREGVTLEAGVAEALARAATGSLRDALGMLDQLMAYGGGTITLAQVNSLIGATAAQEVSALVQALLDGDTGAGLRVVAAVAEQGADLRQFARDVVERLRALLLLKAGGDAGLLDAGEDELAVLQAQASQADLDALLRWTKLFSGLDVQLRAAAIPQLPVELAVVEALMADRPPVDDGGRRAVADHRQSPAAHRPPPTAHRPPLAAAAPPAHAGAAGQHGAADTPHVAPELAASAPPRLGLAAETPLAVQEEAAVPRPGVELRRAEAVPDDGEIAHENAAAAALEQVEAVWPALLSDLRVRDKMLLALLNSGVRPVEAQGNTVTLEVVSDFLLNKLNQPNARRVVEDLLSKHMRGRYAIQCVVKEQRRDSPNKLREQIRNARKDPLVKAAINIFDADVIAVDNGEETAP